VHPRLWLTVLRIHMYRAVQSTARQRCVNAFWLTLAIAVALTLVAPMPAASSQDADQPVWETYGTTEDGHALQGAIWMPTGNGPFPAILYNHDSRHLPGAQPQLGPLFAERGYVFFVPHRRGQGRSSDAGEWIQSVIDNASPELAGMVEVQQQEVHLRDQQTGMSYLQSRDYVDPQRIAGMGCSYGGIQTVLGARNHLGYRAAIAFAPGPLTWKKYPISHGWLADAMRRVDIPTFLIQAANDHTIEPSLALASEMVAAGMADRLRMTIYPGVGETAIEGHQFCLNNADVWGSDVFRFLEEFMPVASPPDQPVRPEPSQPGENPDPNRER